MPKLELFFSLISISFILSFFLVLYYNFNSYSSQILKRNVKKKGYYFLLFALILYLQTQVSFCANNAAPMPIENINELISEMIYNAREEDLPGIANFFQQLGIHPEMAAEEERIPETPQRFGWESLILFFSLTVFGYLIIHHGTAVMELVHNELNSSLNFVTDTMIVLGREAVVEAGLRAAQNPANHQAIYNFITAPRGA